MTNNKLFIDPKFRYPAPKPSIDSIRNGWPPLTKSGRPKMYSFSANWCRDVLLGKVKDHDKVIAHCMELRLGTRSQLSFVPYGELLGMLQKELKSRILVDNKRRQEIYDRIKHINTHTE